MNWAILLPLLLEMFMKCREDREKDEIEAAFKDPGRREWFGLRRAMRKSDPRLRGRALRMKTREAFAELQNASAQDVEEFVEAGEEDYQDGEG